MNRGRRTIRLAKWAGVGLCVVIALAWVVATFIVVGIEALESGVLVAHWTDSPAGASFSWDYAPAEPRRLTPLFEWDPSEVSLYLPLWLPLALLALPTAWLFWLDRRKPRPGFCPCGYDLTGMSRRFRLCCRPACQTALAPEPALVEAFQPNWRC